MAAEHEIKVGETVRFRFGVEPQDGIVKEDRGSIGIGGRHLYRIKFSPGPEEDLFIELPAEKLELVQPRR